MPTSTIPTVSLPSPFLPHLSLYQPQQNQSFTEQLVSSVSDPSPISYDLLNVSPTMPLSTNLGSGQVNVDVADFTSLGQAPHGDDMDMDDPVLSSLQTLVQAGENLGEPRNSDFNVWDWFASQR